MRIKNKQANLLKQVLLAVLLAFIFNQQLLADDDLSLDKQYRIINGVKSQDNAWPWMVALLSRPTAESGDNFNAQFCGGSLIHPEWVLTAAHCFFNEGIRSDDLGTDILIGTNSLTAGGNRISVDQTIIHSLYDPNNAGSEYDIALLHLSSPVTNVTPIPLPGVSYDNFVVTDGANSTVIGWGNTSTTDSVYPADLMEVDVPIVSEAQCKQLMGSSSITTTMLCAGVVEGGKDSCQGDSGGPLVTMLSGEYQLVGVVSWGDGCAKVDRAGVYTRISKFESFIAERMCTTDKPSAPTLNVTSTDNGNGTYTVTVNFSGVSGISKYRLYFAPFVEDFANVANIDHVDVGSSTQFILPSGLKYYAAGQSINNNCVSDFSNIATASTM